MRVGPRWKIELRGKMIDRHMQEHMTEVEGTGAGGGS
jgi:hypothetical protein